MFTWDEVKVQENLDKHGIDFADAGKIFSGYTITAEDTREAYGEQRFLTVGLLDGEVVSVTHTPRGDDDHIISIRKATRHETHFYFSQIPD
ncbi:MAG TPA: BrnT family toxin [Burkholderiales bacterium]|nr:BrnT family toxin [Burkholderiales bacterium]